MRCEPDESWFRGWQVLIRSPSGTGPAVRGVNSPAVRDKGPSVRQLWAQVTRRRPFPARRVPLTALTVHACSCTVTFVMLTRCAPALLVSTASCSIEHGLCVLCRYGC